MLIKSSRYLLVFMSIFLIITITSCCSKSDESEPITISECGEIYYANQEDFEIVKDYINSIGEISIKLDNPDEIGSHYKNEQLKQSFNALRKHGIKTITTYSEEYYHVILFYIDGTSSSRYGVLWRNDNQKFATVETELSPNWYSYFIGYT